MQQVYRWLNIVVFLAVIGVNWAANALPLFGRSTGEISAMYPVAVTPASYAFGIWGLIYALLAGYMIVQAMPRGQQRPEVKRIGPWFIISSLLNIAWLLLWHSLHITSTAFIMLAMLLSLIVAYRRSRPATPHPVIWTRLFVALPFSIYLGWISVATIVNISVALKASGWDGWGVSPEAWGTALLVVAGFLALLIARQYSDPFYGLVIIWACIAIAIEQQPAYPTLSYAAWGVAVIVFVVSALTFYKPRKVQSSVR
ncbi:tryptophan-rich sensory protein [Paenibacillus eucommiae]|uniref:Tryptophan-rich sensory protein n=1 Tax=Paenibacillus eucommiae TaxID=1355755 RepID=A0ABS4IRS9_9BACL|nr:tryptophan-rich sensory protein [Paenibacillus eucommiae]MBP1990272.1 tryptophan-rich sensory protein [Paenibacillus eucommiae]